MYRIQVPYRWVTIKEKLHEAFLYSYDLSGGNV